MSEYGVGDGSYQAAGCLEGITLLVDDFYRIMDESVDAEGVRKMHPKDLELSRKKLSYFLSAWLGGPRLYSEHFGPISIPGVHSHLTVGETERDVWIDCMAKAAALQPYEDAFKVYLIEQLKVPAERIRVACS